MKVVYKEIFKLKVMLDKANIPYEFLDRSLITETIKRPFYQIIVYKPHKDTPDEENRLISVIEGMRNIWRKTRLIRNTRVFNKKRRKRRQR